MAILVSLVLHVDTIICMLGCAPFISILCNLTEDIKHCVYLVPVASWQVASTVVRKLSVSLFVIIPHICHFSWGMWVNVSNYYVCLRHNNAEQSRTEILCWYKLLSYSGPKGCTYVAPVAVTHALISSLQCRCLLIMVITLSLLHWAVMWTNGG